MSLNYIGQIGYRILQKGGKKEQNEKIFHKKME